MLYSVFKHLAFKFDPEITHDFIIHNSRYLSVFHPFFSPLKPDKCYRLSSGELSWNFPVGLAAGFDKNALAIPFFAKLGFGAIELGTITCQPQQGNMKPRIKRHRKLDSLQNSMGFPNLGSQVIRDNIIKAGSQPICLGANIGKNKTTQDIETAQEYATLYRMFAPLVDYLAVNISSPNTPGLRQFQDPSKLSPILDAIATERAQLYRPCFIKISPDMAIEDIKVLCELVKEKNFSGVIATNTTTQHKWGEGGLSGKFVKPMAQKTRNIVCDILREDPEKQIIGVGGVDSYSEIVDFWKMGGSFVQIYTSFIYKGPAILREIAKQMKQDMLLRKVPDAQELFKSYQS